MESFVDTNEFEFAFGSGVIKASLTIPTSSFALNLDDSDIPFIEDSTNSLTEVSKHQMTIGTLQPNRT